VVRVEQIGSEFAEQQTVRPVAEAEDRLDSANKGPREPTIDLCAQRDEQRLQKADKPLMQVSGNLCRI